MLRLHHEPIDRIFDLGRRVGVEVAKAPAQVRRASRLPEQPKQSFDAPRPPLANRPKNLSARYIRIESDLRPGSAWDRSWLLGSSGSPPRRRCPTAADPQHKLRGQDADREQRPRHDRFGQNGVATGIDERGQVQPDGRVGLHEASRGKRDGAASALTRAQPGPTTATRVKGWSTTQAAPSNLAEASRSQHREPATLRKRPDWYSLELPLDRPR
jgi:hypothetical protein